MAGSAPLANSLPNNKRRVAAFFGIKKSEEISDHRPLALPLALNASITTGWDFEKLHAKCQHGADDSHPTGAENSR